VRSRVQIGPGCVRFVCGRASRAISEVDLGFDREVHDRVRFVLAHVLDIDFVVVISEQIERLDGTIGTAGLHYIMVGTETEVLTLGINTRTGNSIVRGNPRLNCEVEPSCVESDIIGLKIPLRLAVVLDCVSHGGVRVLKVCLAHCREVALPVRCPELPGGI